jgi:hypothetical protein
MFVCCECCVLSGRGLCDELITRPGKSYRLWCVVVCDLETSKKKRQRHALGRNKKKKKNHIRCQIFLLDCNETGICWTDCSGYRVVPCGQTDGHDETNNCFSQFCESTRTQNKKQVTWRSFLRAP